MILSINNVNFPLPDDCEVKYLSEVDSTHIFFNRKNPEQYLKFINSITDRLQITRFVHNIGIVFGHFQIFFDTRFPPEGVNIII